MGLRNMHEATDSEVAFWTSVAFAYAALVVFVGAAGTGFRSIVWQFPAGWSWLVATVAFVALFLPLLTARRLRATNPAAATATALTWLYSIAGGSVVVIFIIATYGDRL